ncbi:MAG: glycosyl transferase, group 2 family [Actinomycetia bacterium]|nr:glycosyl transferase, group 2 family [Actinomycetes bacterium]
MTTDRPEVRSPWLRRAGVIPAVITGVDVGALAALRRRSRQLGDRRSEPELPLYAADALAVASAAVVEHVLARDVADAGDPHVEHVRHPGVALGMAGAAIVADVAATTLTDAALRAVGRRNLAVAKTAGLVAGTAARFAAQRTLMGRRLRSDSTALRERRPPPGELRLSVVVPAYREQGRIATTVDAIRAATADVAAQGGVEIIVVDDGSNDGTAPEARRAGADLVLEQPVNRGKGASVRRGVERARGRTIVFIDADLAYAPEQILRMLAAIELGHDVAVGNRRLRGSTQTGVLGPVRVVASRAFNLVTRALLIGGYADTQSGLKAFRSDAARRLFSRARIDRFAFDVEILHLVERYHLSLVEIPVTVTDSETSTVRLLPDALRVVRDVLRIRSWAGRGLYDEPADTPEREPSAGSRQ